MLPLMNLFQSVLTNRNWNLSLFTTSTDLFEIMDTNFSKLTYFKTFSQIVTGLFFNLYPTYFKLYLTVQSLLLTYSELYWFIPTHVKQRWHVRTNIQLNLISADEFWPFFSVYVHPLSCFPRSHHSFSSFHPSLTLPSNLFISAPPP